ncbi:hypothetical protein S1OALGB6SA_221 [Olavius algarvensis spirochete endosymbiont]|nr:hypothetical protein S1OALGB6SA_221 [Olavius algarvensis spirochete endosymbiont]
MQYIRNSHSNLHFGLNRPNDTFYDLETARTVLIPGRFF